MEITQLDYYAALELTPAASLRQIENAYQFAMENYAPDSLAAYGLLSDEEREEVVSFLSEARRVLCDAGMRREYDRKLVASGRYPAEAFAAEPAVERAAVAQPAAAEVEPAPELPLPASEPAAPPAAEAPAAPQRAWWPFEREKPAAAKPAAPSAPAPQAETPAFAALDGRPIGPGELRQIREHRGLRLEEVSEKSKISLSNLRFLEEGKYGFLPAPVYVKGFLRTYAGILRIDADKLVRDYMPAYEAQRPS